MLHHTTFLAALIAEGRLVPRRSLAQAVTYHDPCYLGRYNGEIDSPRAILDRLGVEHREMERSGLRSSCCGGGGGAPLTDVAGKRRIPDIRMDHARATGAHRAGRRLPQLRGHAGGRGRAAARGRRYRRAAGGRAVSRLRIERRRLAEPAANGRLRRDPRAERLGTPSAASRRRAGNRTQRTRPPRSARRVAGPPAPRRTAAARGDRACRDARRVDDTPPASSLPFPISRTASSIPMTAICWAPGGCSPTPVAGNLVVLTPGDITADFAAAGADHLLPVALPSGYAPEAKTAAVLGGHRRP